MQFQDSTPVIVITSKLDDRIVRTQEFNARQSPSTPIIIITQSEHLKPTLVNGVYYFPIEEYCDELAYWNTSYLHFSSNYELFEFFCMARWSILSRFIERTGISRAVHMDSDVLVFSDLTEAVQKYKCYDLSYSKRFSGHIMIINCVDKIKEFAEYQLSPYSDKNNGILLEAFLEYKKKYPAEAAGGISDMYWLSKFAAQHAGKIGDTNEIIDNSAFNDNIWNDEYYCNSEHMLLAWHAGLPYGFHKNSRSWVQLHILHLQGGSKDFLNSIIENHLISKSNPNVLHKSMEFTKCKEGCLI